MRGAIIISLSLSAALLIGAVGISGCTTNKNMRTNTVRPKSANNIYPNSMGNYLNNSDRDYGVRSIRDGDRLNIRSHDNNLKNLRFSQSLSNKVAALKEVRTANVFVSDHTAYVAVSLRPDTNKNRYNTRSIGQGPTMDRNVDRGLYGSSRTGSYGVLRGMTANNRTPGSYRTNTVANDDLTEATKDKIAKTIQHFAPQIKSVYVSANPDFIHRVNSYVTDIQHGKPISGFINQFRIMIERIFPTNARNAPGPNMNKSTPTRDMGR
ncbi:YhcN/YlaJ family sporulation lipoprotein [Paenibacillus sediminis]|uniref:YhcN/YlaJ family sporulation lipoprotein n=1 Tax=Paenibacillus sediminis TaxID=664909 RepID=A0ABS4H5S0_9BACL|nr:YhcN/YlaJ family sporulation lipoprotein [Paenibacillus sediminis]MBP1937869.1 hypothetical protein [Paenibacillus sediminis]